MCFHKVMKMQRSNANTRAIAIWTEYCRKQNFMSLQAPRASHSSNPTVSIIKWELQNMPPALPHDFSTFILPPKEKNRCVGISKAPADCVCGVYCSHAVEDLHKIMFLFLAQDLAFPPVQYFCLCVLSVDVTTITKACFF